MHKKSYEQASYRRAVFVSGARALNTVGRILFRDKDLYAWLTLPECFSKVVDLLAHSTQIVRHLGRFVGTNLLSMHSTTKQLM